MINVAEFKRVLKVSVKVNLGMSLIFFVSANLELVGCEVHNYSRKKFLKN